MTKYRAYSPMLKKIYYIDSDFHDEYVLLNINKKKKCYVFETMETLDVQYNVNVKDIKGNDIFEEDILLIDGEKYHLYYNSSKFTMVVKKLENGKETLFWEHLSKKIETLGYIVQKE